MKTSDLIDEAVEEKIEAAWLEVARRRQAELCDGAAMAIEGEQVFGRIHDRYVSARKQS